MSILRKPLVRFFNELIDQGTHFEKRSVMREKILAEYHFLNNIPEKLKAFYPSVSCFADDGIVSSYQVEKIPVDDASIFMVQEHEGNEKALMRVIELVKSYLEIVPSLDVEAEDFERSVLSDIFEKNLTRLKDIILLSDTFRLDNLCIDHGFQNIEEYCIVLNAAIRQALSSTRNRKLYYSHGDLCLSNILVHENSLRLIDPRGHQGDLRNTFRVIHYDLAKLSHSIMGSYDKINHFLFEVQGHDLIFLGKDYSSVTVKKAFEDLLHTFAVDLRTIRLIEASLFLSLIPFHRESELKVRAFLINSLKIFKLTY